jgi:hypothetical protein
MPRKRKAGKAGKKFRMYGSFKRKRDARARERKKDCKACFVLPRRILGKMRYMVLGAKK